MIFDKTNIEKCLNKSKYEDIYVVYSFALAVVTDSKKKRWGFKIQLEGTEYNLNLNR